ncbi:hypothetical protein [Bacillus luti]
MNDINIWKRRVIIMIVEANPVILTIRAIDSYVRCQESSES